MFKHAYNKYTCNFTMSTNKFPTWKSQIVHKYFLCKKCLQQMCYNLWTDQESTMYTIIFYNLNLINQYIRMAYFSRSSLSLFSRLSSRTFQASYSSSSFSSPESRASQASSTVFSSSTALRASSLIIYKQKYWWRMFIKYKQRKL